jgi:hypothetical protein
MVAKTLDKYAGALSILWTLGGYAVIRFGISAHYQLTASILDAAPVVPIIWFGIFLLLVNAGIRRGNTVGRNCSFCAIGLLFLLSEPLHGFGDHFRKNEYARIYSGAPECLVTAKIQTDQEAATFIDSIRRFAKQHDIRECRQKRYGAYSGLPRPTHKGEHVAIWSGVGWTTNVSEKTGRIRLAPFDEAYPVEDFKRLADSLASIIRSAFQDRVEVIYKEPEKQ